MKASNEPRGLKALGRALLDLLYPPLWCPCCGAFHPGLCPVCSASFKAYSGDGDATKVQVLYDYEGGAARLLERYKRGGSYGALAEWVKRIAEAVPKQPYDGVAYAPSSMQSRRHLGFDHGRELAKGVAKSLGIPVFHLFHPPKKVQKKLHQEERRENAATIRVRRRWSPRVPLKGKRLLLLDDVITTGHTMEHLRDLLNHQGVQVHTVALAKVVRITLPK